MCVCIYVNIYVCNYVFVCMCVYMYVHMCALIVVGKIWELAGGPTLYTWVGKDEHLLPALKFSQWRNWGILSSELWRYINGWSPIGAALCYRRKYSCQAEYLLPFFFSASPAQFTVQDLSSAVLSRTIKKDIGVKYAEWAHVISVMPPVHSNLSLTTKGGK